MAARRVYNPAKHWAKDEWNDDMGRNAATRATSVAPRAAALDTELAALADNDARISTLHDALDAIEQQDLVPPYRGPPGRATVTLTGGKKRGRKSHRKSHRKNRKSHRRNRK
jgi:hypothetical protein